MRDKVESIRKMKIYSISLTLTADNRSQENTTFRKLDLFPSSGEGGHLLYRKTKSLPFHRRCQNRRRSTTGNKGTINTWPQEESMGCNKRIRNEKFFISYPLVTSHNIGMMA
jgi:hypothetical protein